MRFVSHRLGWRKLGILLFSLVGIIVYSACYGGGSGGGGGGGFDLGWGAGGIDMSSAPVMNSISGPQSWQTSTSATITWSSSEGLAATTYYCSLNGGGWYQCGSGDGLGSGGSTTVTAQQGGNTLSVYATNSKGTTGSLTHAWSVDSTPPTGGNLSVPSSSRSGSFTVGVTNWSDNLSQVGNNIFYRRSAPLSDNTCGAFGDWTEITRGQSLGDQSQSGLGTACYQYALNGVNNAGITAGTDQATFMIHTIKVDRSSPASLALPTLSGTERTGQTLSSTLGTWSGEPTSYAYQWQRCDTSSGNDCLDIAGATSSNYTLQAADAGKFIRIRISATNVNGTVASVSARTSAITNTPQNITPPTISKSGSTYTVQNVGAWNGSPSSYTYQWQRCNGDGTGCVNITGETGSSYTIAAADETKRLRVAVVASNASGASSPANSSLTDVIDTTAPTAPTLTSTPDLKAQATGASFSFTGEAGGSYQCKLDSGSWTSCTSPKSYSLAEVPLGEHTFRVRQTDASGNIGAEQSYTWMVGAKEEVDFTQPTAQTQERTFNNFWTGLKALVNFRNGIQSNGRLLVTAYKPNTPVMPSYPVPVRGFRLGSNPVYFTFAKLNGFQPGNNMEVCLDVPAGSIQTGTPTLYRNPNITTEGNANAANAWHKVSNQTYTPGVNGAAGKVCGSTSDFSTYAVGSTPEPVVIASKPSSLTNSASATFQFSGEAGNTFQCKIDDGAWGACSSPKTYTSLADGNHTFQVKQIDPDNQAESNPTSYTWTVDTQAPTSTISSGPNGAIATNDVDFAFATEADATFECRLDGGSWESCTSPKSYTDLADGSHTFDVRASDAAGNTDPSPASRTFTVDTTAPAAPTISTKPSNPTKETAASFSFAGEAGSAFECKLDEGAWTSCTSPKSYSSLADGSHTFSLRQSDAAGNTSEAASYSFAVDTEAPVAPVISTNPASLTNNANATFSFTGETGATFECKLDSGSWESCTSPKSYTNLSDSAHTFSVRQSDLAGNTSDATTYTWNIDTEAPAAPTISTKPDSLTTSASASFSFTGETGAAFACKLDEGAWESCTSSKSYSALADGSHTFSLRQTDAAGNTSAAATYTFEVDTTAPAAPTISTNPSNPTKETTATFEFTGETDATFECKLDTGSWTSCTSPKSYTNLADGTHTFSIRQSDVAGNTSGVTSDTFTVDTEAPVAPVISTNPASLANNANASFSFTGEADATHECKIDSAAWESCTSPKSYAGLSEGSHTFSVKQTDLAGNTSDAVSYTWNIDTEAPAAPTISTKPDNPTTSVSASFAFQGEEGADYQCKLDTGSWESCTSPKSYSNLSDGSHTFALKQTDTAANTSTAADYTWTIDSSAPEAPSITAGPAAPIKETAASFEFTAEAGATYECQLNDGAWATCVSPKLYSTLTDGAYTFRVRASDSLGNTSTVSERSFSVDTTPPPAPVIIAKPNKKTSDAAARFTFTHDGTAQCKLDEGAWTSCTSPKSYADLAPGAHTFSARALDSLGNISEIALYSWIAETSATSLEGETDIAADVSIASAIQIDTSASALQDSISEGDLEGLDTVSEDSPLSLTQDLDLRSNAIWTADLFTTPLTASNGASITLNDTDSSGDPNINNAYQGADVSATGGVDWSVNAGTYEGTATVTATNTY